jgi:hypothetical protein
MNIVAELPCGLLWQNRAKQTNATLSPLFEALRLKGIQSNPTRRPRREPARPRVDVQARLTQRYLRLGDKQSRIKAPHGASNTWGTANAVDAYGDLIVSHQAACVTPHGAQAACLFSHAHTHNRRATH